ncbi:Antitermination NusB domain-containing protein isoform 1 [Dorcoceras hygrometricum]|uniref:Antitermination NusB domain-containing protein isoform 1 n=1 Tax=Dorcoceras hygrometricum TaxID=472368 RepID=A0A2Z7BYU0_9LAMI|nr:Antitermination NusB domain-containing protein isoform 1 [Dorcoceras hygrometricum]
MEAAGTIMASPSSSSSAFLLSNVSPKSKTHINFIFNPFKNSPLSSSFSKFSRLLPYALTVGEAVCSSSPSETSALPKIDKSGRFCSPRSARELALMILYASCLDGSDPVRHFEKRLNTRRESGYEFDKASLVAYDHMSFGGPPVTVQTSEEAEELLRNDQKESDNEAVVLSAPPKLVYSKLILRFTRKLLVAVVEKWDSNVLAIEEVAPLNWKNEPAGRILELSILHLAMSEISCLGTKHQIVINEAVDLAKRFCDGAAPRIINGCLRTFVEKHSSCKDEAISSFKINSYLINFMFPMAFHSMEVGIEGASNSNLFSKTQLSERESPIDLEHLDKVDVGGEGKKKRSNWSKAEDEILARSFVTISDVLAYNDGSGSRFPVAQRKDTASRGPTTIVTPKSQFRTCPTDHDSIGYPRMKASGESSTTKHRLLHASGPHPIPPPNDPKTNQYNQDLRLIHSTNGNHLESPNEDSSIDHQVTTMFPTNETWYFASQMLVSSSGGLILILTAQSTRNEFRIHRRSKRIPCWHLCLAPTGVTRTRLFSVDCGRLRQSGPRPEPRLLRQAALEALTNSARTDSPRRIGRNKFPAKIGGGGGGGAI